MVSRKNSVASAAYSKSSSKSSLTVSNTKPGEPMVPQSALLMSTVAGLLASRDENKPAALEATVRNKAMQVSQSDVFIGRASLHASPNRMRSSIVLGGDVELRRSALAGAIACPWWQLSCESDGWHNKEAAKGPQ
jgi:hypothetical protein